MQQTFTSIATSCKRQNPLHGKCIVFKGTQAFGHSGQSAQSVQSGQCFNQRGTSIFDLDAFSPCIWSKGSNHYALSRCSIRSFSSSNTFHSSKQKSNELQDFQSQRNEVQDFQSESDQNVSQKPSEEAIVPYNEPIFPQLTHDQKRGLQRELGLNTSQLRYLLNATRKKHRILTKMRKNSPSSSRSKSPHSSHKAQQVHWSENQDNKQNHHRSNHRRVGRIGEKEKIWILNYLKEKGILYKLEAALSNLDQSIGIISPQQPNYQSYVSITKSSPSSEPSQSHSGQEPHDSTRESSMGTVGSFQGSSEVSISMRDQESLQKPTDNQKSLLEPTHNQKSAMEPTHNQNDSYPPFYDDLLQFSLYTFEQQVPILRKLLYFPGHSIFISKVKQALKRKYITSEHMSEIQKATGLQPFQIYHLLDRLLARPVSRIQRDAFLQWISRLEGNPSAEEQLSFRTRFGLTAKQLNAMIRHYRLTRKLTNEERQAAMAVIDKAFHELTASPQFSPTKSQVVDTLIDRLLETLPNLSRYQAQRIIAQEYEKRTRIPITEEHRTIIREFMLYLLSKREISYAKTLQLSHEHVKHLKHKTGLSSKQILGIAQRYFDFYRRNMDINMDSHSTNQRRKRHRLSPSERQEIETMFQNNSIISDALKQQIQERFNLSRQQLNLLIWRYRNRTAPDDNSQTSEGISKRTSSRSQMHYNEYISKFDFKPIDDTKRYKIFEALLNEQRGYNETLREKENVIEEKLNTSSMEYHGTTLTPYERYQYFDLHPEQIRSIRRHQELRYLPFYETYMTCIEEVFEEVNHSSTHSSQNTTHDSPIIDNDNDTQEQKEVEVDEEVDHALGIDDEKIQLLVNLCKKKYPQFQRVKLRFFVGYFLYFRNRTSQSQL